MTYVGIQTQIRRNNFNSILLMIAFPMVLLGMVYAFLFFAYRQESSPDVKDTFIQVLPFVIIGTGIWFVIAWLFHNSLISMATGSRPLKGRKTNEFIILSKTCVFRKG